MTENARIWVDRDYANCSGCRLCEIACSLRHEDRVWPEASRVRVFMLVPGVEIPHLCVQCYDYPCVNSCRFDALRVSEDTGAVQVDAEKCTACGVCTSACPGHVPHLHPWREQVVICDLCDGDPECVKVCQKAGFNALSSIVPRSVGDTERISARTPGRTTSRCSRRFPTRAARS